MPTAPTAGVSVGNDDLRGGASTETGLGDGDASRTGGVTGAKPRNGGRQAVAPSPAHGVETQMAPNRKFRIGYLGLETMKSIERRRPLV
jgi:hypothetical protein